MDYVDMAYVKAVSSMPAADIDALEALYPGTFATIATAVSRVFDGRLSKRYNAPFTAPYPEALRLHVAAVVAYRLWLKRGFNPSSEQDSLIKEDRDDALAWLKEAADSEKGLVELPLREDLTTNGVVKTAPLAYSEQSPYAWTDSQLETGRLEDT